MNNKERVNVKSLYSWIDFTIKNYGSQYGDLLYQTDWIPLPDYFFENKNDKIFSSAIQISYDDKYFCFGIVTQDYIEPIAFCSIQNVMNNDEIFQKELGFMLTSILNRQENSKGLSSFVEDIKNSILKVKNGEISYLPYNIKEYFSYSEKQEKELLNKIFTFETFKVKKSKNSNSRNISENADEIYNKKYNELSHLFYSPNTEKYPIQEIINSESLKIEDDELRKGTNLIINGVKYIVNNDIVFKNYKEDVIESLNGEILDVKASHKGEVYLTRSSDNNLYSMDVYIKEKKDNKGIYYFGEIIEEQLYIHNVTVNLPEDNRNLTMNSCFIDSKFKEMYKEYDVSKSYRREDFKDYFKKISALRSIDKEVLNAFKDEFKNNKNLLLKDDFDIRKWSDKFIYNNYGLDLTSKKEKQNLRKKKLKM